MRQVFVQTLMELAEQDPRIVLLTADLGLMISNPLWSAFPRDFLMWASQSKTW